MNMNWKSYISALIALLILDIIWLYISKNMYNGLVRGIQCGKDIEVRYIPAILCYIVLFIGIVMFALPLARDYNEKKQNKWIAALLYGGLFGVAVYGVFNLTNLAIFDNYKWYVAGIDTLWGFTVSTLTVYAGLYFD